MRLGFLCQHNPLDKNAFSGTASYLYQSLLRQPAFSVRLLGRHATPNRILDKLRKRLIGPGPLTEQNFEGLDVVFAPVSTGLVNAYAPCTDVPFVHCTDATPSFLREFYGLDVAVERDVQEQQAYDNANLVLFSSSYMMERALDEVGEAYRPKMAAIPWGANLDNIPDAPPEKPPLDPVRLLFIGKDWVRKGGDIAVAAQQEMRARGVPAELHIVGSDAEAAQDGAGVIRHGYFNKNRRKDWERLQQILRDAHVLLLPTRADCTPMVVAEANSYGIPVLITNVGGVASLMRPGENGDMFPLEAGPHEIADLLLTLTEDDARYGALSKASYHHFSNRLTWEAWAEQAAELMRVKLELGRL